METSVKEKKKFTINKKFLGLSLLIVGVVVVVTVFISLVFPASDIDSKAKKTIESALEKLKNTDKYQISNIMQAPDGNLCYVEICSNGSSYTEYPVDSDGNFGTIAFQDAKDTEYVLTDWVTSKGKGYVLEGDNSWVSYPSKYAGKLQSRDVMYCNVILNNLTSLEFKETVNVDIGMGVSEELDVYLGKIPSETAHSILGMGSEEIYKAVKDDTSDSNIKKLCDFYLEDIGFTMVFSDANVLIGVSDGVLRYIQIEVGGLGTRLYYTKAVLTKDIDIRPEPDFSNVLTYESTLKDMADYVSKYDSYEDAMKALNQESNGVSDTILPNENIDESESTTSQSETSSQDVTSEAVSE